MNLDDLKRTLAKETFGETVEDSHSAGRCIMCKRPPLFYSEAGQAEFKISGLCEFCFDISTLGHEDAIRHWKRLGIQEDQYPPEAHRIFVKVTCSI